MGWKPEDAGTMGKIIDGHPPAVMGLNKRVKSSRHEFNIMRPDPYNDCLETFRRIEEDGKMTPEIRHFAEEKMAGLKAERDAGTLKGCDFERDAEHPLMGDPKPQDDDE